MPTSINPQTIEELLKKYSHFEKTLKDVSKKKYTFVENLIGGILSAGLFFLLYFSFMILIMNR